MGSPSAKEPEVLTTYGWMNTNPTPSHAYVWPAVSHHLSDLPRGARVLDLGCGNGWTSARMAECGFEVSGMDASQDGIELAQKAYPNIHFLVSNIQDPIPDLFGTFDAVVSTEVIEHLFTPRVLFIRSKEYLKPSGKLIISTPYHGYFKNLAISILGGWDAHHTVQWDGGHIKFFSRKSLQLLAENFGFREDAFSGSGRVPFLWKSMVVKYGLKNSNY